MKLEVEAGTTTRAVTIHRKGAQLQVVVNGKTHLVDARRVSDGAISLLLGERSVDAGFAPHRGSVSGNGGLDVHLCGVVVPVQIRQAGAFGRQKKDGAAQPSGPQRLVAPMPGKVVRVLVKAGDTVKAKQGLVVVEAMKMENELRAARDGRVRDVMVTEGQSVDAGTALAIIE
jgi:acetyl/propionyl-CoA carboxylase alpha subunit